MYCTYIYLCNVCKYVQNMVATRERYLEQMQPVLGSDYIVSAESLAVLKVRWPFNKCVTGFHDFPWVWCWSRWDELVYTQIYIPIHLYPPCSIWVSKLPKSCAHLPNNPGHLVSTDVPGVGKKRLCRDVYPGPVVGNLPHQQETWSISGVWHGLARWYQTKL